MTSVCPITIGARLKMRPIFSERDFRSRRCSKARGTDDSESDIDLLLITSVPVSWRERRSITDSLFDLQIEREVVISPLVISRDDWLNGVYQVLPIRREIDRDGAAA